MGKNSIVSCPLINHITSCCILAFKKAIAISTPHITTFPFMKNKSSFSYRSHTSCLLKTFENKLHSQLGLQSLYTLLETLGRFYLFFQVALPGCGGRRIKRLVILFVLGYTAGLPRFAPVSPGHERPGESGVTRRCIPVQIK